jgi:riboflavin synthase
MFTGIVQAIGKVKSRKGPKLDVATPYKKLKLGESVAVEGVCLTVTAAKGGVLSFDVSEETYDKTTLGRLTSGSPVNLETAARVGDPLGGHIVQGHVDGTGQIVSKKILDASIMYEFSVPLKLRRYLVPKGSVAVDGISLTAVDVRQNSFTVAVIPHTEANTSLGKKKVNDPVNLEMDILAKHVERLVGGWKEAPSDNLFEKKVVNWDDLGGKQ